MAIITEGSIGQFSVEQLPSALESLPTDPPVDNLGELVEAGRRVPTDGFRLAVSPQDRGLAMAKLRLDKDFQSFLTRLFHRSSDVYFLTWCWDLSGLPVSLYPGTAADPSSALIPMRGGEVREFMGAGAVLFPARPVTAGVAARVQIWESAKRSRDFGRTLATVAETIRSSELNAVLSGVSTAVGVAPAAVALVEQAALQLAKAVGVVLQATTDDYVDFYEGYFPVRDTWAIGETSYRGRASEIVLNRFD